MNIVKGNRDIVVGGALLVFCILVYFIAIPSYVEENIQRGLSPAFFPKLSVIWIALFAAMLMAKSLLAKKKTEKQETSRTIDKTARLRVGCTIAAVVLYLVFCPLIGYIASTILTLLCLMGIFGEIRYWVLILVPVIITLVIYLIFGYSLDIVFP